jgi:hypothetical protein
MAVLVVVVTTLFIALSHDVLRNVRIAPDVIVLFVLSIVALVGLLTYWRRYWFRLVDLRRLISAHAGTDAYQRSTLWGIQVKAKFETLWMLATLNRPILDVLPTWPAYEFQRKVDLGLPEFMLEGARVGIVQLGDFHRFPHMDIIISGKEKVELSQVANEILGHAIRDAAEILEGTDVVLRVEIRSHWVQVEVDGGAWLGSRFAQKIELALEFSRRLIGQLAGAFAPLDPAEWTIDQEYVRAPRGRSVTFLERRLYVTSLRGRQEGS